MTDILHYERDGSIVRLTINRPDMRNALGEAGDGAAFQKASATINADEEVKCVILSGAGSAFSAGGNIKAMAERKPPFDGEATAIADNYRNGIHKIVKGIWDIKVPVIAAVNGAAIGLGNDIACLCDIRIAGRSAKFGATFLKLGLIPGDGGAWILPRLIGASRAAELLYTGKIISAAEAKEWGIVSYVVDDEALSQEAEAMAAAIIAQSGESLRATKRLLRHSLSSDFDTILEMSATTQAVLHQTDAHHKALVSMLDK